jgi:hypothetical protein
MKKIIFGVLFLVSIFVISGCELAETDPQKAGFNIKRDLGGGGGGSVPAVQLDLADLPEPFVSGGSYNNVAMVVGVADETNSVSSRTTVKAYFDAHLIDSSVPDLITDSYDLDQYDNLVLLGSPCYNGAVAEYMGLTYPACGEASTIPVDTGIIKLIERNGQVALIIAVNEANGFSGYKELMKLGASLVAMTELFGTTYTFSIEPEEVTYQGVLDMLNSCEVHNIQECIDANPSGWYSACNSCDEICNFHGGTCIAAARSQSVNETIPDNYGAFECGGETSIIQFGLFCTCCAI